MNAFRLAWLELRRFRLRRLLLVVLTLVPLLAGSLYLWANWDPYGQLNKVPVAVTNSDRPVEVHGTRIEAGARFERQLRGTELFDWHFVSARQARAGLEDGRYYATIEVPRNFSSNLAATAEADPRRAELRITTNDANNYLVGIMTDTVKLELQQQINAAAHNAYARTLYAELHRVRHKLETASEVSGQLVRGMGLGQQGASSLNEGLRGIQDSAGALARGASDLADSAAELNQRFAAVTDFTSGELPDAVNSMVRTSGTAVNSLSAINTATGSLLDRANDNLATLESLGQRHSGLTQDPLYQQALGNARQLSGAAANADQEAQRSLDAAHAANSQAEALQQSLGPLRESIARISTTVGDLRSGAAGVRGGADGLNTAVRTLTSGGSVLGDGAGQLDENAKRVHKLIGEGLNRIPPANPDQLAHAANVLGSPAELRSGDLHPAHVYGKGMTPLFFSIALWLFGIVAYLLFRPVNPRALASSARAATIAFAGWLPASVLGILGGLLLFTTVHFGLGLAPWDVLGTVGMICLGALSFLAVTHFLRLVLGMTGVGISLALLIVQIPACGGLFPLETTPAPFRAIHPVLPMSYLVDGLRVTTVGGLGEHLARDALVLGGFLFAFLLLSTWTVHRQRDWTPRRLHAHLAPERTGS